MTTPEVKAAVERMRKFAALEATEQGRRDIELIDQALSQATEGEEGQ